MVYRRRRGTRVTRRRVRFRRSKRGRSSRRSRRRSKRTKRRRLADKKINTLYERRAKQIADKAVQSVIPKFIQRETWLRAPTYHADGSIDNPGAVWPSNDTWPQPLDLLRIAADDFQYYQIARVGGYIESDIAAEMIQGPAFFNLRDLYIRLHTLRLQFDVLNPGVETQALDIMVFRCPYNKHLVALDGTAAQAQSLRENPVPQRGWLHPLTTFNTITGETVRAYNDSIVGLKIGVTKVMGGRYFVPPGKMLDDPTQGGGARVNQAVYKRIRLNKTWKGKGKKEMFENEVAQGAVPAEFERLGTKGSLSHARYFLCLRASGNLVIRGVSAVRFSKGKDVPAQMVFDALAQNVDV